MRNNDLEKCKRFLSDCAVQALIDEVNLTPKPGLVDRNNNGVHNDLSLPIMLKSAESLRQTFEEIAAVSYNEEPSQMLREEIARIGRDGEKTMYQATGGTNSHKGAIWSLGLLVSSAASKKGLGEADEFLETAGKIARYRDRYVPNNLTNGLIVKKKYNIHGAKEVAESGFLPIKCFSLPTLLGSRLSGMKEEEARLNALVSLIAHLDDTCILHRGGSTALNKSKNIANQVLNAGGVSTTEGSKRLRELDETMHAYNASPGGCADLLAATLFIDTISTQSKLFKKEVKGVVNS
ncbi:triphosphoribosyl-dephospho-CoA synthase [Alkalihalophilus pseudofirmus]|uniref:triphosphoribosyl-dephospho-CoA synthase n=1 Tax=Alkalihalophilus pseudofirmus TaxID=79885 RepID=UPI00259B3F3F|nr:triphosphoribosyl-dephospho-CoA synthase [Alkalihalophilus pseudofirmus]WEG17724.1 triphosphoribosyl-dephospho-CoA synthase [Alkalihalophilus pseudofirmus]